MEVFLIGFTNRSVIIPTLDQISDLIDKEIEDSFFPLDKKIEITEFDLETKQRERSKKEKFIPAPPEYKYSKHMRGRR